MLADVKSNVDWPTTRSAITDELNSDNLLLNPLSTLVDVNAPRHNRSDEPLSASNTRSVNPAETSTSAIMEAKNINLNIPICEIGTERKLSIKQYTKYVSRAAPPHQVSIAKDRESADSNLSFVLLTTADGKRLLGLVDSGASLTLIRESKASELKLKVLRQTKLTIVGFGSMIRSKSNIYELPLASQGESALTFMATGSPAIPYTRYHAPSWSDTDLKDLQDNGIDMSQVPSSAEFDWEKIDMIVGNDFISWANAQPSTQRYILKSGRTVEKTPIGIIVHPEPPRQFILSNYPLEAVQHVNHANILLDYQEPESEFNRLNLNIEQLWRTENIGMEDIPTSDDGKRSAHELLEEFNRTARYDADGNLEVALPFNGKEINLKDNKGVAMKRLQSLDKTLKPREDQMKIYNQIFVDHLSAKYIEEVTDEMLAEPYPQYIIPHHAVLKEESETTKVRIVFDASSHDARSPSLNDCLHAGTNMINRIFGILSRTRFYRYLIVADIEKAFHQVRLQKEFRNCTMFMWLKDISKPATPDNIQLYRFTRIPFGVSASPFLLAAYIVHYLDHYPHTLNEAIKENIYVDNCLFYTNNRDEIPEIIKNAREVFTNMGMNLREFTINDREIMDSIPPAIRSSKTAIKLLGYTWDSVADTFSVKLAKIDIDHPTKRQVASKFAETYDPLGLITPAQVGSKRIVQQCWKVDLAWNKKIPAEALKNWKTWKSGFSDRQITVQRQVTTDYDYSEFHLLMFSDASQDLYGTAAYACFVYPDKPPVIRLITSKNKIRPVKNSENWTIPKMELAGLTCSSNLASALVDVLKFNIRSIHLFSDSSVALFWTLGNVMTRVWVNNRRLCMQANKAEMLSCGIETTFHHCPTKENPADLLTRGLSTSKLKESKFWFEGPNFVTKKPEDWPCMIEGTVTCPAELREQAYAEIIDPERKKSKAKKAKKSKGQVTPDPSATVMTTVIATPRSVIPYEATNSLPKLCRIMRLVLRAFTSKWKNRANNSKLMNSFLSSDSRIHQERVTRQWIIHEHYRDSEARGLIPFKDNLPKTTDSDGLMRVRRSIRSPVLPQEAERPILIHNQHPLAALITRETHIQNGHLPESYTRAVLRTKYWIPKDASVVQKTVSQCVTCKRVNGYPYSYPYAETLPAVRTTPSKPFAHVGLDYMGPLEYQKDDGKQIGKAYILIYTCLTTRGAVLKVIPDATAQSYVMTLKMIFNEVGVPSSIYSDNAETFTLGGKVINQDIIRSESSNSLTSYLASEGITMKTITPMAPWQGGIYERVVGLVKRQLQKVAGAKLYDYFSLQYIVSGCQSMVNNRPLIAHSRSPGDMIALRPIDFQYPGVLTDVPVESNGPFPTSSTEASLRAHLESLDKALERLWSIWSIGYLTLLRDAMHQHKRCSTLLPAVGDVVTVVTKLVKKHKWPLAIIVQVIESKRDGEIRSAVIRCKGKLYVRAVCQLVPLEINALNRRGRQTRTESAQAKISEPNLPSPAILDENIRYSPELFPASTLPNIAELSNKSAINIPLSETAKNLTPIGESGNLENDIELEDPVELCDHTGPRLYQDPSTGEEDPVELCDHTGPGPYQVKDPVELCDHTGPSSYRDPNLVVPEMITNHDALRFQGRSRDYLPRKSKRPDINYALSAQVLRSLSHPSPRECCAGRPIGRRHKLFEF